ncbi:ankyrin repeat domain-containing protein, partial [Candidatus Poribacteria bacterium]|nr:ankyrin repeat domain-containing protein [Candidatus Poribacteria bacterium]
MPERDAVLHAARDGKIEVVRESLDADPSLMAARDENGGGPLHMAAMRGHADIAALLLERGVERDAGNDWGWTPIVYAAYNGRA